MVNTTASSAAEAGIFPMKDAIGWLSSLVLLATVLHQVSRQWRRDIDQAASLWLFSGQIVSSLGFTLYSVLLRNWVFTATNAVLLVAASIGLFVAARKRKSERALNAHRKILCRVVQGNPSPRDDPASEVALPDPLKRTLSSHRR